MIRIQLLNEGKIVKQITSRVHESVMLEQVKQFKDAFDTIQIVEGNLSEDAKSVLQHVARKIIPAAMAAGVAMGGANANAQGGANPNYSGMDRSIGQHISDIVSPRYNEIQRQRKYEQETQRKEWDAHNNEIRQGRVDNARATGRAARGATHYKLYDQSRISKDGKFFIIYGMDDKITRIPTAGTEFMAADSQRLAHYISPAGQVYYVRHPHNNGLGESVVKNVKEGSEFGAYYSEQVAQQIYDKRQDITSDDEVLNQAYHIVANELGQKTARYKFNYDEDFPSDVVSNYFYLQKQQGVEEGIAAIGTVGSIPASGASSMTTKTKFDQTGSTTDVKFNAKGQLELDDELDADAVDTLKKAGVEIAEASGTDPELSAILDQYTDSFEEFKNGGDITDNNDFYEALFNYFSDSGEMPYGVAKAREGDPAQWIVDKLNQIGGHQPMGESDDEASLADQASADKNIIMQLRRASDYEIPVPMELGDGSSIKIDSHTADKMLAQFDKLKPESKALMQQTLNTAEGFREMLNYFNEREVLESMDDIDLISTHMKPVLEAELRVKKLISNTFGTK